MYKSWLEHFLGPKYCTPKNISKSSKAGTEGPVKLHAAHMRLCPGFLYYQNMFGNQLLDSNDNFMKMIPAPPKGIPGAPGGIGGVLWGCINRG